MSSALQASIQRWQTMADGLGQEASEVQKALIQVRTEHSDLCAEQEKIRRMKLGYVEQLKANENTQVDLQQSTHLRRFMGQLDRTTQAIVDQIAELQRQHQTIADRFRELSSERIKFETLATRAREQLKHSKAHKEQKEADMLSTQRFVAQSRNRLGE